MRFEFLYWSSLSLLLLSSGLYGQVDPSKKDQATFPLQLKVTPKVKPRIMSLVVEVKGEGNRFLADEDSFSLVPGRLIPSKGLFVVGPESSVTFRPMPGITALLMDDTRLQMKDLSMVKKNDKVSKRSALLFLNEGAIFTSIQKLNNKITSYQIQTPQTAVSAKGTKFWVSFKEGKGKVGVLNGVVEVKMANGDKMTLKQNEFIEMDGVGVDAKPSEIRPPTNEENAILEKLSEQVAKVEGVTASVVNPFLTTSEAQGNDFYEERVGDGIPNSNNTSDTPVVSPPEP